MALIFSLTVCPLSEIMLLPIYITPNLNISIYYKSKLFLYQVISTESLCQVNVGNYSFFFMTNIFSFKTAVIDGSFRHSPLVCLLAAGSSFCQGQSHMWCSAPLTENCSDSLSVIKRTMPFLVLPYIFLTIERSHKCLGRRTLHCVQ